MAKARIQASQVAIDQSINSWFVAHQISLKSFQNVVVGRSSFYKVSFIFNDTPDVQLVESIISPRTWTIVTLDLSLFVSLIWSLVLIHNLIVTYNVSDLLRFLLAASLVMLSIWLKSNYLWLKLTKIENSFWQEIQQSFDVEMLSRSQPRMQYPIQRIITETILSIAVLYACFMFSGWIGLVVSAVLCLLVLVMMIIDALTHDDFQTDWRFWIIRHQFDWTWMMLATLGLALFLAVIDLLSPMLLQDYKTPPNLVEVLQASQFRTIVPSTSDAFEADALAILTESARQAMARSDSLSENPQQIQRRLLLLAGVILWLIIMMGIIFFSVRPIYNLFRNSHIWRHQVMKRDSTDDVAPFVPTQKISESWRYERLFRGAIFFYIILGSLINVAAQIFYLDSLSYVLFSRALLFKATVNLWSWHFVTCRIIFGEEIGQILAIVTVLIVSLPLLLIIGAWIRRLCVGLEFLIRILLHSLHKENHPDIASLKQGLKGICQQAALKVPRLLPTRRRVSRLRLWHGLGISVIEFNTALLDSLTEAELMAAMAHELGHLQQGQGQITLLKLLSTLAMFPNYVLALCIDWPKLEHQADQFAVEATNDPDALKHALVKIAAAQISYNSKDTQLNSRLAQKFRGIKTVLQYYLGDSLLGYAHPSLTERLEAIDSYVKP